MTRRAPTRPQPAEVRKVSCPDLFHRRPLLTQGDWSSLVRAFPKARFISSFWATCLADNWFAWPVLSAGRPLAGNRFIWLVLSAGRPLDGVRFAWPVLSASRRKIPLSIVAAGLTATNQSIPSQPAWLVIHFVASQPGYTLSIRLAASLTTLSFLASQPG